VVSYCSLRALNLSFRADKLFAEDIGGVKILEPRNQEPRVKKSRSKSQEPRIKNQEIKKQESRTKSQDL
jgi:hypothetical protein